MAAMEVDASGDSRSGSVPVLYRYVLIDSTTCNDCYGIPSSAMVIHALRVMFAEDRTKTVKKLFGHNEGVWRVETENIALYESTEFLLYNDVQIGSIIVKNEELVKDADGNISATKPVRKDDELLVTLTGANMNFFSDITDAMLLREIVMMDIGELKKAPTPQVHYGTDILNGNKFFVLEKVMPEQLDSIPNSFNFGGRKMFLNFRGKKRHCSFCCQFHSGFCEIRDQYDRLVKEREDMKKSINNLPYQTYGTSVARYFRQEALASDVHAMSGATLGNLLNAHEVNTEAENIQHLIFIAGNNELNENYSTEEFMKILDVQSKRLIELAVNKKIGIITPPLCPTPSAAYKAKAEKFSQKLKELNDSEGNISVWGSPFLEFDEDQGLHPSPEQTKRLINYLNEKLTEKYGHPYKLPSASDELMTTNRKYFGVRSLYKYGCGACNSKDRNKFYSVCGACKDSFTDTVFQGEVLAFKQMVDSIYDGEHPSLQRKRSNAYPREQSDDKRNRQM